MTYEFEIKRSCPTKNYYRTPRSHIFLRGNIESFSRIGIPIMCIMFMVTICIFILFLFFSITISKGFFELKLCAESENYFFVYRISYIIIICISNRITTCLPERIPNKRNYKNNVVLYCKAIIIINSARVPTYNFFEVVLDVCVGRELLDAISLTIILSVFFNKHD